jgi:hypothetical protein
MWLDASSSTAKRSEDAMSGVHRCAARAMAVCRFCAAQRHSSAAAGRHVGAVAARPCGAWVRFSFSTACLVRYAIAQGINFVDTAETLERSGRASLFLFHVVPWRAIVRVQQRIVFA